MSTINKPLPHRPFSLAGDLHKAPSQRRQHPQLTSASHLRPPYVQANDKLTVPPVLVPVPKRTHLVTRSPSPPYHQVAISDALPSSRAKPPHQHSLSQSTTHSQSHHYHHHHHHIQSRSPPLSSASDLIPPHLKSSRTPSFWRRHWNRIARLCLQSDPQHASRRRVASNPECVWVAAALRRAEY